MIFSTDVGNLNSMVLEDLSLEAMELVDEVTKAFLNYAYDVSQWLFLCAMAHGSYKLITPILSVTVGVNKYLHV